jgi:hypothetical protein
MGYRQRLRVGRQHLDHRLCSVSSGFVLSFKSSGVGLGGVLETTFRCLRHKRSDAFIAYIVYINLFKEQSQTHRTEKRREKWAVNKPRTTLVTVRSLVVWYLLVESVVDKRAGSTHLT